MKKIYNPILLIVLLCLPFLSCQDKTAAEWTQMESDVTLYWVNDMGRNGYYDQKTIAELMGVMAETVGPEAVMAVGDIHHFSGVESTSDPLWMTNYELIYSHPELMCFWYPVLGNHEYRGHTQSVLDYAQVSRRWAMPSRYYSKVFEGDECTVRVVFIDTTPLISKYRDDAETYPDAHQQDIDKQLAWLDSTLTVAKEDWVICVGHHPIYAQTPKMDVERTDMQQHLLPVLRRHPNVSLYGCGHIHNFQHIKMPDDPIHYWVNSAAALSRPVEPVEGTRWCDPSTGFTVVSANKEQLTLFAINKEGKILYTLPITK